MNIAVIIAATILVLIAALRVAWKIIDARSRHPTDPGYVTVCVYGENGTRYRVRRPISESGKVDDYDIPDFLRRSTGTVTRDANEPATQAGKQLVRVQTGDNLETRFIVAGDATEGGHTTISNANLPDYLKL